MLYEIVSYYYTKIIQLLQYQKKRVIANCSQVAQKLCARRVHKKARLCRGGKNLARDLPAMFIV